MRMGYAWFNKQQDNYDNEENELNVEDINYKDSKCKWNDNTSSECNWDDNADSKGNSNVNADHIKADIDSNGNKITMMRIMATTGEIPQFKLDIFTNQCDKHFVC